MRLNLVIAFLLAAVVVPVIQQVLCSKLRIWSGVLIAGFMYLPGLLLTALFIQIKTMSGGRVEIVQTLTSPEVFEWLLSLAFITSFFTILLEVLRRIRQDKRHESGQPALTPGVYMPMLAMFFGFLVVALYLVSYDSLEDAVRNDNLELARRRLVFNLAGVGPDNGLVEDLGTAGVHTSSLLPLAVKNGSTDMVALLVEHGAQLNPKPQRVYGRRAAEKEWNMLYHAIRDDNIIMLKFLVDLGVNPTRGIVLAVKEHRVEHLAFLLESGADILSVMPELREKDLEAKFLEMQAKPGSDL